MVLLEANGLGKRFDYHWIFRNLNFSVSRGDVLIVRGNNGSGKSTLLKILAGLVNSSEGTLHSAKAIGYSALDGALYAELTPEEHLRFAAKLQSRATDAGELLDRVGLKHAQNQPARQLSTGMKTRLKLALAIQNNPDLLILDEPTAGLDAHGKELVLQIISDQKVHGAVIFATNIPEESSLGTQQIAIG